MTPDVKLLPLPEKASDETGEEWTEAQMEAYARANMEPLIAENERLRAEAAKRDGIDPWAVLLRAQEAEARAERLAEALRHTKEKLEHVAAIRGGHGTFAGTYLIVTEALDQEGGNG